MVVLPGFFGLNALVELSLYDFSLEPRAGRYHLNADAICMCARFEDDVDDVVPLTV